MADQIVDLTVIQTAAVSMDADLYTEAIASADQLQIAITANTDQSQETATTAYSMFIPNFDEQKEASLISSTFERYNKTIRGSLEKDFDIIQQKVNLSQQSATNNFFRNAKWSPDGSCLLTSSADDVIRLFQLPANVYEDSENANQVLPMVPTLGIREGESVYDFAWFPSMNAQDPSTCCFLTSVRDHPIRLWDVSSGTVRASYSAIDHVERFIGPNVLSFNLDGSKIYCGYENMIEIFDVHRPGPDSTKFATIPKRKSRKGQKGIISCLDFCPDYSGIFAAGSYSQSIGIYDETNNELCLKLTGFEGGTTQVKFSKDGKYLFSASRHANSILCWDIRDSANILYELPRPGKTNQRISFDIDATGKYLMTGDQHGNVLVYDVSTMELEDIEKKQRLVKSFKAHNDITSCATFNPVYPVITTCSGQRKFCLPVDDNSSSDSDDDEEDDDEIMQEVEEQQIIDNTLKTWRVPGQYEWYAYPQQEEELVSTECAVSSATESNINNSDYKGTSMSIENATTITEGPSEITSTTNTDT